MEVVPQEATPEIATAPDATPAEAQEANIPFIVENEQPVAARKSASDDKWTLAKKILFCIGAFAMFFVGVFYMLMSDLTFNNKSNELIVATLLSLGSAILFFFSASFNEKPKIMFLLKGIALALALGFLLYIHFFQAGKSMFGKDGVNFIDVLEEFKKAGIAGAKDLASSKATMVVTLVFGYISLAGQIANTVLTAVIKEN